MTNQEIFDRVASHLRGMRERSGISYGPKPYEFSCKYRDGKGGMCAIGALIPDEMYNPAWDDVQIPVGDLPEEILSFIGGDRSLLYRLQKIHDHLDSWDENGFSEFGEAELLSLAVTHNLTYTPPAT